MERCDILYNSQYEINVIKYGQLAKTKNSNDLGVKSSLGFVESFYRIRDVRIK